MSPFLARICASGRRTTEGEVRAVTAAAKTGNGIHEVGGGLTYGTATILEKITRWRSLPGLAGVSVTCQIKKLEQPIHSKPDKLTPWRKVLLQRTVFHKRRYVLSKNTRIHAVEMGFTINVPVSHPLGVTGDAGKALPVECEDDDFDYVH